MKKIYDPYLITIENALNKKKNVQLSKGFSNLGSLAGINNRGKFKVAQDSDFKPSSGMLSLSKLLGVAQSKNTQVGLHPDFAHLIKTRESEFHNITSTFIDIKGSTSLYGEYDHEEVFIITNTILSAAINTCHVFGGHIQRLQGDGVFTYFGGRTISEKDALVHSLTSTSVFTYFVKNDLKRVFETHGIENINTRIGIDIGNSHEDVMWAVTGTQECYELTTLSLHTSLAYKAQQKADPNAIIVGKHVKDKLPHLERFFIPVTSNNQFEDKFNYKLYNFDWFTYLKSIPFIKSTGLNELDFFENENTSNSEEQERLNRLRLASVGGYVDKGGRINSQEGVVVEPNRFHYDKDSQKNK